MAGSAETATVEVRGHRFTVDVSQPTHRRFWTEQLAAGWERATLDFVERYAVAGAAFLDIGAWVGPFSLVAASQGARVIALEPDPVARAALEANVRLNDLDIRVLASAFDAGGDGLSLHGGRRGFGASTTSAARKGGETVTVPTVTAADLAEMAGGGPAAIKIDIEAHEFACAAAIADLRRRLNAPLHLSLHPRMLRRSFGWRRFFGGDRIVFERTLALLEGLDGVAIEATDAPVAVDAEGLRARLLGAPGGVKNFDVVATPISLG